MECVDVHAVVTSLKGRSNYLGEINSLLDRFTIDRTVYIHADAESSNFLGPNKGDESHGYIKFIIDHYDNLPKTVMFLHDDVYARHNKQIELWISCVNLYPELPYTSLLRDVWMTRDVWPALRTRGSKLVANTSIHDLRNVSTLGFYCCANFIVGREAILSKPVSFYHHALEEMFREQVQEGRLQGKDNYGAVMEHSWHAIFGMPWFLKPLTDSTACWHFDCKKPQCLYSTLSPHDVEFKNVVTSSGFPTDWRGHIWEREHSTDLLRPGYIKHVASGGKEKPTKESSLTIKSGCRDSWCNITSEPPMRVLKGEAANYVTSGMFRDLADYVQAFPYAHFNEPFAVDTVERISCLRPAPIIFSARLENIMDAAFLDRFPGSVIVITTQTDGDPTQFVQLLDHKNLFRWFAANWSGKLHPKLEQIPLGLCYPIQPPIVKFNSYSTVTDMTSFLGSQSLSAAGVVSTKLLALNWGGNTHPHRNEIWQHFCNAKRVPWATCILNNVTSDAHKPNLYAQLTQYRFLLSPRGNGVDTYRTYEAIHLGVVPIVQHSGLDALYSELPVLLVDNFIAINESYLEQQWKNRFSDRSKFNMSSLFRPYWVERLKEVRRRALIHDGGLVHNDWCRPTECSRC